MFGFLSSFHIYFSLILHYPQYTKAANSYTDNKYAYRISNKAYVIAFKEAPAPSAQ